MACAHCKTKSFDENDDADQELPISITVFVCLTCYLDWLIAFRQSVKARNIAMERLEFMHRHGKLDDIDKIDQYAEALFDRNETLVCQTLKWIQEA